MEYLLYENDWWWGHSTTIIAEDGKSTIDLSVTHEDPEYGCLRCLMVHDSVQHQGRGSQIMKFVEEMARQKGLKYIYLVVNKSHWIKDWYERLGFVNKGEEDESGGQTVQMMKDITQ